MTVVDVLIAGGGVAGATLAILLGRAGFSVELFERARFPREKPCGEGLMPAGAAVLDRLGLAQAVGGAPFHGVRYHFGKYTAEGRFPGAPGASVVGRGLRRRHLDRVLFEAAATTPGVTAHEGVQVHAPLLENGRVTGALVGSRPVPARLLVAADGPHSRIRHCLGLDARSSRKRFGIRTHYRLAPGQAQLPWVDVFFAAGHELYVTPLPNHEILIAALTSIETNIEVGASPLPESIYKTFQRWIFAQPLLAARLEGAEQISPPLCASWLGRGASAGSFPGAVLLGDAYGSIDPLTGGGMTHALLTAELLAACIPRAQDNSDGWMPEFEHKRCLLLQDFQRLTKAVLWLSVRPRLAAVALLAARRAPPLFSHLVGVAGGTRKLFRAPGP